MPGRCKENPDWTEAEDAVIHRLAPLGTPDKAIALELTGRSWGAVHKRRQKLGYYRATGCAGPTFLPRNAEPLRGDPKDKPKTCPLSLSRDVAKRTIHGVLTGAFSAEAAMLAVMDARGLRHG